MRTASTSMRRSRSRARSGGIVAPPMMLDAWTMQGWEMHKGYDTPQNEEHRLHKILSDAGYTGVFGTDTEQAFHRYLKPGDSVTAETVIEQISDEKSTGARHRLLHHDAHALHRSVGRRGRLANVSRAEVHSEGCAARRGCGGAAQPAKPSRLKPPMGHDNGWWWDGSRAEEPSATPALQAAVTSCAIRRARCAMPAAPSSGIRSPRAAAARCTATRSCTTRSSPATTTRSSRH